MVNLIVSNSIVDYASFWSIYQNAVHSISTSLPIHWEFTIIYQKTSSIEVEYDSAYQNSKTNLSEYLV